MSTHDVANQPTEFIDINLFVTDPLLQAAVEREGAGWFAAELKKYGEKIGSATVQKWAEDANRETPRLITHDRFGHRVDQVEYHPSYHELMKLDMSFGLHNLPWVMKDPSPKGVEGEAPVDLPLEGATRAPINRPGAHVARSAMMYLSPQADFGHGCPFAMTYAVVPSLKKQPEIYQAWKPYLESKEYDPRFVSVSQKKSAIFGMAMTEKQGGSDLRANTSKAIPINTKGPGKEYLLTGHKWFCSAPMSDAFLTLAKTSDDQPPTCFLLPRFLPDGTVNNFFIQRLKDKVGNRSNASSEIEFEKAFAWMIGEEHRGIATIIEMAHHTRLDCIAASAGMTRFGIAQAIYHCRQRSAFGKKLIDQDMMKNVLADLCLESEAMTIATMRLAKTFDKASAEEELFQRLATPVLKYWVCKRAEALLPEIMECMGSNTFIEESPMARLYRDIPTNALWEGPGNVMGLDVQRVLTKQPETWEFLIKELGKTKGSHKDYDQALSVLENQKPSAILSNLRRTMEQLALLIQAQLMIQSAPSAISDIYCQSRLTGEKSSMMGLLPNGGHLTKIIDRYFPQ